MDLSKTAPASVDSAGTVLRSATGRWASERFEKATNEGRDLDPSELRDLDTLRKDVWLELDDVLINEATIRLRVVADLVSAGLTKDIPGGLGRTVYEYENVSDMNPATISMDGLSKTENERVVYERKSIPLPMIHKDFRISQRSLLASKRRGEPLDTTQVRLAGRQIAETLEELVILGGPTFDGKPIYGLATHPNLNVVNYVAHGAWDDPTKIGQDYVNDVILALAALEADRMYGPYAIYIGTGVGLHLEEDFKANSDKTIRQRLLEIEGVQSIRTADKLPAGKVLFVQMTSDVIELLIGEQLQTIKWDVEGGMQTVFKGMTMQVPLMRIDQGGHCGIAMLEAA